MEGVDDPEDQLDKNSQILRLRGGYTCGSSSLWPKGLLDMGCTTDGKLVLRCGRVVWNLNVSLVINLTCLPTLHFHVSRFMTLSPPSQTQLTKLPVSFHIARR